MIGCMPYNNTRKRILHDKIVKQEDDAGGKDRLRAAKLTVKGQTNLFPIYRFQLDDLAYNKSNGRIKAEVLEKEADLGRTLDQFNVEDGKIIGDILRSIRRDENEKIKEDLRKNTQIMPGIVTIDGIVINGNRRKALLKELYQETHDEKYKYLDAHMLPSDISKAELWLIEAGIQLSAPQQLDYSPINNLLKIREGINSGLTSSDMASRIYGVTEDKINSDIERLDLIDEYLTDFLEKSEKYYLVKQLDNHFINLLNILNYFNNPRGGGKDWAPTQDDINELKLVAFYYIRMRMPHLRIRDLKEIFQVSSSWQKVRLALSVNPNLSAEERRKFQTIESTELNDSDEDDELTDNPDENEDEGSIIISEDEDLREEATWRENRKTKLKNIFEDAKEQRKIHDNAEKPLILAQRALNNIQGIPNDEDKLADPELDMILSEIIQRTNVLRKTIKKNCKCDY